MRPNLSLLKAGSSSNQWLARQVRDSYVRARTSNPMHYRARSAFKLLQLNDKYKLFGREKTSVVIDLGAAPGGWSQVVADSLGLNAWKDEDARDVVKSRAETVEDILTERAEGTWSLPPPSEGERESISPSLSKTIISVDILPVAPIRGVRTVRQDFLDSKADELIASLLPSEDTRADLILSDIAPNMSGNETQDTAVSIEVCRAVYLFARRYLRALDPNAGGSKAKGGHLVLKYFEGGASYNFRKQVLKPAFDTVYVVKPDASRSESSEHYFVCKGFRGDKNPPKEEPSRKALGPVRPHNS